MSFWDLYASVSCRSSRLGVVSSKYVSWMRYLMFGASLIDCHCCCSCCDACRRVGCSGVFRHLNGGLYKFQVYIFKSVQNLAYFFTLNINTIFYLGEGRRKPLPLNTGRGKCGAVDSRLGQYDWDDIVTLHLTIVQRISVVIFNFLRCFLRCSTYLAINA